jgi:hypothetical protein
VVDMLLEGGGRSGMSTAANRPFIAAGRVAVQS